MGEVARPGWSSSAEATGSSAWREWLALMWTVTRREIRDTRRDWRLVVPILVLTLVFPILMSIVADMALSFVRNYGATIIGENTIPFFLMVVGFFPISFSLVIALESFVGEKERQSLEPLLATPLSNTQLYLAKTLAALIPPVLASYLGIFCYLAGLFVTAQFRPSAILILQIVLLTTAEACVMVTGAVIVSSHTTSVRAANLLASFIIVPMAFLIQGEAWLMFWMRYDDLWYVLAVLLVLNIIMFRMGIRIFNREELLGREIDSLNLKRTWRLFKAYLAYPPMDGRSVAVAPLEKGWRRVSGAVARFYRQDLARLLRASRLPVVVVLLALIAGSFLGWWYAARYPLPPGLLTLEGIDAEAFEQFDSDGWLPTLSTRGILSNNVRALLFAALLAVFSFGSLAVIWLMLPVAIIAFLATQAAISGYNVLVFLGAFVLPHGILEMPAAILATALALRLGAAVISPPPKMTMGQGWLWALADFIKAFVLIVLPLLALAAFVEANITPEIVVAVYGN